MDNQNRRTFMRNSLLAMAALPLGASLFSRSAFAQTLTPLDPEAPQAKALNYVKVASEASSHAMYKADSTCLNCMFYQAENSGCQLFPQNSVEAAGWCQSWVQKP